MLLRHDSLEFSAQAFISQRFPGTSGFLPGAPYPHGGRTCVQAQAGQLAIPRPSASGPGTTTCIFGCLLTASGFTTTTTILEIQDTAVPAVRIRFRPTTGTRGYLQVERGNSASLLLISSEIDLGAPTFLEVRAVIHPTAGSVEIRLGGFDDSSVFGLPTTAIGASDSWQRVVVYASPQAPLGFVRVADIYLADAVLDAAGPAYTTFLGPVRGRRLFPFSSLQPLSMVPSENSKYRLVILAGQSNNNGRGFLPYPGAQPWRSPNPAVQIWTPDGGGWQALEAGVNTWGFFEEDPGQRSPLWGPEMMFAELLAQFYEHANISTPNVRLLKLCRDGSFIAFYPGSPGYSWSELQTPDSLFYRQLTAIDAAVASLGGWGNIESVDYYWYQGESEALFPEGPPVYQQLFTNMLNALNAYYAASWPSGFRVHRVLIHAQTAIDLFRARDGIRSVQQLPSMPGNLITIDEGPLLSDRVHLAPRALDILGTKYFYDWLSWIDNAARLKDYFYLSAVDDLSIESSIPASDRYAQVVELQLDMINTVVLAHQPRIGYKKSDSLTVSAGPAGYEQTLPTAANANWAHAFSSRVGHALPELVCSDITLTLA